MNIPSVRTARRGLVLVAVVSMASVAIGTHSEAPAKSMPSAQTVEIAKFVKPIDIAARRNDAAIYVAQQSGEVMRFVSGASSTALDISELTKAEGEQGLLGLVFNSSGSSMFINYTNKKGDTVVARYAMNKNGTAQKSTRVVLFTMKQPYANHNGGGIAFGPNGRLFIGTGDGGSGGDPKRYALNVKSKLGKVLSINPNASSEAKNELVVWSRGLRNPWRFEFDTQGNLWIADVGQNTWEEVNFVSAKDGSGSGKSFGWSAFEANTRFNKDQSVTGHVLPVHSYKHGDDGCSISGGTRIRDKDLASLKDWYVYSDYCSGVLTAIWVQENKTTQVVELTKKLGSVTAVRTVYGGAAYVLTLEGNVYRIVN